eukprot:14374200-Heterocapsa_arctica.AAC.1
MRENFAKHSAKLKNMEDVNMDETRYIRDKIKELRGPLDRANDRVEAEAVEEAEEEEGAMENDMSQQEETDVLEWMENNPEIKEAAKATFDKTLLTETRQIANKLNHLG